MTRPTTTKRWTASLYDYLTLKRRIIILFLFSTLTPFVIIGLISYYAIYSILTNKIQTGVQSNLKQVERSLESSIANLNHISQQLAFEGTVGRKLDQWLKTDVSFEQFRLTEELKEELRLITFTNPTIGLTFYYFKNDGATLFENLSVRPGFTPDGLPLLARYDSIAYYGPHVSNNNSDNQIVLSALRKVDLPERDDVYVYIETGFRLTQNILSNDLFSDGISHMILDNDGRIAYSEVPAVFKIGSVAPKALGASASGSYEDVYWFKERSNQGWSVVTVIPKAIYNKEMNRWFLQITLFSFLFLALSVVLAWLLWKMVYRPLNNFNTEIKRMTQSRSQTDYEPARTKIPEFDYLLNQFGQMKRQIWKLFAEVEQKEKRRVDLEVEKLLHQINPHFLMNSLDTVHWLAVMNGQTEIDRLVSSLNKLLYYNLGKLGEASTVREEIDALKQYLTLQQIRYDFQFDVRLEVDEAVLNQPIPRFILQPLVENSLYHGLSDDGYIQVEVRQRGGIEIAIHDNGAGMSEETIRQLLHSQEPPSRKVGLGIGMNYVRRMLESQYGDRASLHIRSVPGQGTSVFLSLPPAEGEDSP